MPGNFAEKRLARYSNNKRPIVDAKAREIFQQREIMLERFSEPDSRIERERHWINTELYGAGILLSKKIGYFGNDIGVGRGALHRLWRTLHVHDDETRTPLGE